MSSQTTAFKLQVWSTMPLPRLLTLKVALATPSWPKSSTESCKKSELWTKESTISRSLPRSFWLSRLKEAVHSLVWSQLSNWLTLCQSKKKKKFLMLSSCSCPEIQSKCKTMPRLRPSETKKVQKLPYSLDPILEQKPEQNSCKPLWCTTTDFNTLFDLNFTNYEYT